MKNAWGESHVLLPLLFLPWKIPAPTATVPMTPKELVNLSINPKTSVLPLTKPFNASESNTVLDNDSNVLLSPSSLPSRESV